MSQPSLLTSSCVTYSHLLYLSGPQFPLLSKKHHNTYTSQGCCEYEVRQSKKVIQGQAQRRGFIHGAPGVAGVIGRRIPHGVPSTWNLWFFSLSMFSLKYHLLWEELLILLRWSLSFKPVCSLSLSDITLGIIVYSRGLWLITGMHIQHALLRYCYLRKT